MVITGGENVYPAEIERALHHMEGVRDVAVVGAPDPKWGETVVAVLQVAPGHTPTLEDVRTFGEGYLARYKLPRELWLVEEMPRNAAGKLDKPTIRDMVIALREGSGKGPGNG